MSNNPGIFIMVGPFGPRDAKNFILHNFGPDGAPVTEVAPGVQYAAPAPTPAAPQPPQYGAPAAPQPQYAPPMAAPAPQYAPAPSPTPAPPPAPTPAASPSDNGRHQREQEMLGLMQAYKDMYGVDAVDAVMSYVGGKPAPSLADQELSWAADYFRSKGAPPARRA